MVLLPAACIPPRAPPIHARAATGPPFPRVVNASHRSEADRAENALGFRRLFGFSLLFIVLSGLGAYAVYAQVAGHSISWDARLLAPGVVGTCLALLLVYFAADGLRLWFTLRALGEEVPLGSMARLVFLNLFVSNVTPMATGGGIAQVWFLQRRAVPIGTALTATTIRTALAVLFIFGATPILLLTMPGADGAAADRAILLTLLACGIGYVGFFAVVLLAPRWLMRPLLATLKTARRFHVISRARHLRWRRAGVRELQRFARGFGRYFAGRRRDIAGSFACTAIFLLTLFSFPAVLFAGLGYDLDYWLVIGRLVITTFVMYFSPTPGASGIAEGVFGQFFSDVVGASHLVLATVAWRALTIHLGMAIGVVVAHRELARPSGGAPR